MNETGNTNELITRLSNNSILMMRILEYPHKSFDESICVADFPEENHIDYKVIAENIIKMCKFLSESDKLCPAIWMHIMDIASEDLKKNYFNRYLTPQEVINRGFKKYELNE